MTIEDEARDAYRRYVETRGRIERGELPWSSLEDHFTDDVVFVDPAWGRVEGIDACRKFWVDSMVGLEDWTFPEAWTMVEGNRVVSMWWQEMGTDADGTPVRVPGVSILYYAGDGRFCYEHDILNMTHVMEGIAATGWTPTGDVHLPPEHPNRDASMRPERAGLTDDVV